MAATSDAALTVAEVLALASTAPSMPFGARSHGRWAAFPI